MASCQSEPRNCSANLPSSSARFDFRDAVTSITGPGLDFSLARPMDSHPPVLAQKSARRRNHPQPDVVVCIVGIVPVAVGRTAVFGVVIPRTTAQHPVVPAPSSLSCKDKSGEYLLSELPGIAVHEVCLPTLYGVDDIC